jgi:predicted metal-binding membrane protein
LLPAGALALAGLYQLTPLKAARQDRLVAAPDLAVGRWCVHVPLWAAVRIGFHHGGVCAACCWPLMLPLFAIGHGNIIAMALVGSVMAAETLTDWGRELRVPIGIGLLTGSLTLLIV